MINVDVVDVYRHTFAARLDAYSRWTEAGWRPVREDLTAEVVAAGLTKKGPSISGFMIAPGNQSHIAGIDFDLDNGMALASRLAQHMATLGAPAYIEGSRRGAHVWILLMDVSPAKQIRAALSTWLTGAGMPMDPDHPQRIHPKIELRPGTDQINEDGLGHALRLPLMPHPKTGQRYRIATADGERLGPKLADVLIAMDWVRPEVVADAAMRWSPKVDLSNPSNIPSSYRPPHAPREEDESSASEILSTLWGAIGAAPGKVVSCPAKSFHSHGDVHKGCKVFPDDRRVMCHKPGCVLNGDGKGLGTWHSATSHLMVAERVADLEPIVAKVGLGYMMSVPDIGVSFHFSRVRRRSDEIRGYLTVKTKIVGVKTFGDNVLVNGNLDILGTRTRKDWAATLKARTPGIDLDWLGLLDYFSDRITAAEMQGEPILKIGSAPVPKTAGQWAIKPLVPRGVASLMYAPGGSGKSQMALGAALSVQLGREIIPGLPPSIKGPVLYLDWETQKEVLAERLQRICRGIDVPPPDIHYRRSVKPLADDAEEIAAYVAENGIVFLVVDSCEPAMGRANEYGDANEKALRLFDALRLIGISSLVVDHVSKAEMSMNGRKRGKMPYGSVYKVNLARAAWEVKPVTTLSDETIIVGLHHTKANDSRLMDPIGLQIRFDNQDPETTSFRAHDGSLETYEDAQEDGRSYTPAATAEDKIAELLDDQRMFPADIAKYLALEPGTVRSALSRMVKKNTTTRHEDGRYGA